MKIYKDGKYIHMSYSNSKSKDKNNDESKDNYKKRKINIDIYYPRVNDESIYDKYKSDEPIMTIINMSPESITILSKIFLDVGDFINFSLALGDYPSFWCLCEVKNIKFQDKYCEVECELYSLTMEQISKIKEYINSI